eukprot:scaffold13569_cov87-Isochrysis_galbana.AAC.1
MSSVHSQGLLHTSLHFRVKQGARASPAFGRSTSHRATIGRFENSGTQVPHTQYPTRTPPVSRGMRANLPASCGPTMLRRAGGCSQRLFTAAT